jgi:NAD-dependent deacetylase
METMDAQSLPSELIASLRGARRVAVLTGAGVSAESGIPTFRDGVTGLWEQFDVETLASPAGFRADPARVWAWYADRRRAMDAALPNAAHLAIAELERRVPDFTLMTQNIDHLHQRAGSRDVIELHGSIHRARCSACRVHDLSWDADGPLPPRCPACGGLLRPDVVWFGELLPQELVHQAAIAAIRADVFLSVGTSGLVEPAASLPFEALRAQAVVVEVNPAPTPLTEQADFALRGSAAEVLPCLVEALGRRAP